MNLSSPRLYSVAELRKKIQREYEQNRANVQVLQEPHGLLYEISGEYHMVIEQNADIEHKFDVGDVFSVITNKSKAIYLQASELSECSFNRPATQTLHPRENYERWETADHHKRESFRNEHPFQFAAMKAWEYETHFTTPRMISDDLNSLRPDEKNLIFHAIEKNKELIDLELVTKLMLW